MLIFNSLLQTIYLIQRFFKLVFISFLVISFLIVSFFHHLILKNPIKRKKRFSHNVSFYSKIMLNILNIDLKTLNTPDFSQPKLIVSNHVGILDIFIICSRVPTLFVTSIEMRETPILGLLTELGGCIYVERRSRLNIKNELKEIEDALSKGFNVVLFPEGKSTNGECVLPFKKTLLMSCANTNANLLPAVLNFKKINDEKMNHKYRDWVCWYDDVPFIRSVWNATKINYCVAELEFLTEIMVTPESDRTEVALNAHKQIDEKYIKIINPNFEQTNSINNLELN